MEYIWSTGKRPWKSFLHIWVAPKSFSRNSLWCRTQNTKRDRISSTSNRNRDLFHKRWQAKQGHNSNAHICLDSEFHKTGGVSAEFYGWTAKAASIGTAIRQIPLHLLQPYVGRWDSKIKWLPVLIFHRTLCYGSMKWRWSIHWKN